MQTAHYGLNHLAKIKPGDKVLIHTAAGGVGLMALQLAQNVGAKIYATASESKQSLLKDMGIEHVYDSRNTDFGARILHSRHDSLLHNKLKVRNMDLSLRGMGAIAFLIFNFSVSFIR